MVVGTVFGVAACGGNPFGGKSDEPTPSGGASNVGEAGQPSARAGEGTGASGGAADGRGGEDGGSTPPVGGSGSGGSGGGLSAGGSDDGAAGEPSVEEPPVFTMSQLVDDMEDGNATLLDSNGDWFVFKDKTAGTIQPPKEGPFTMSVLSPARGASTKAAVVTVAGFTEWGAAFGFDFRYVSNVRQAVDLGAAVAVQFWAKASKTTSVRLQLPNADTDEAGGKCSGTGENACNAHWTKAFTVGTAWKQTTILLSELKQDLPGRRAPSFDKQHVYSTFFVMGPNQSVTVWVDDLALVH